MSVTFPLASHLEPLEPRVLLTTLYSIEPIPPPDPAQQLSQIRISDVNDASQVTGTVVSEDGDSETLRGFLWSPNSGTIELPTPSGMNSSAEVLNPQGVVAGFLFDDAHGSTYQFDGSEMQEMSLAENLPLNSFMVSPRMAFRGRTVSVLPLSNSLLPHWADRPRDTVTLYGDISRTFGVPGLVKVADANNSGIVITRSGPAYGPSVLDGSILRHIQEVVTNASGWRIDEATAINNLGQIVGTGLHNGSPEGFILTPISDTPEPLPIGPNDEIGRAHV